MRTRRRIITLVIGAVACAVPARGQGTAPSALVSQYVDERAGLGLDTAIARALEREPSLRAVRSDIEAARGMQQQAGLRPNPTLTLERRDEPSGTDSLTSIGIQWPLRAAPTSSGTAGSTSEARPSVPQVQEVRVAVTEASFDPQRITLRAGAPARITFTRTSDKTCATAVVFESLNIRRELPLNVPVTIEFTPDKAGEIAFACGMNMLRGTVVVQ